MSASEVRLGEGTRGRIIEEIAASPKTARDLARSLGIQESAARGHLERLEERGLVVPTFRREGVGRPRKRYLLTPQGQELFPRRYELLLETLMEELARKEGSPYVADLFAGAARAMAREVTRELPKGKGQAERARALAAALNHLGFRCTTELDATGLLTIVRTNCVFRHLAQAHSALLCDVFDKNLTEALLGQVGVDLKDSITRGSLRCTHLVQLQ